MIGLKKPFATLAGLSLVLGVGCTQQVSLDEELQLALPDLGSDCYAAGDLTTELDGQETIVGSYAIGVDPVETDLCRVVVHWTGTLFEPDSLEGMLQTDIDLPGGYQAATFGLERLTLVDGKGPEALTVPFVDASTSLTASWFDYDGLPAEMAILDVQGTDMSGLADATVKGVEADDPDGRDSLLGEALQLSSERALPLDGQLQGTFTVPVASIAEIEAAQEPDWSVALGFSSDLSIGLPAPSLN